MYTINGFTVGDRVIGYDWMITERIEGSSGKVIEVLDEAHIVVEYDFPYFGESKREHQALDFVLESEL